MISSKFLSLELPVTLRKMTKHSSLLPNFFGPLADPVKIRMWKADFFVTHFFNIYTTKNIFLPAVTKKP